MGGAFRIRPGHNIPNNVRFMLFVLNVDVALGTSFWLAKLDGGAGVSLYFAAENFDIVVNALYPILSILLDRIFEKVYRASLVFQRSTLKLLLVGHGFVEACGRYHLQDVRLLAWLARAIRTIGIVLDELGLIRQTFGSIE